MNLGRKRSGGTRVRVSPRQLAGVISRPLSLSLFPRFARLIKKPRRPADDHHCTVGSSRVYNGPLACRCLPRARRALTLHCNGPRPGFVLPGLLEPAARRAIANIYLSEIHDSLSNSSAYTHVTWTRAKTRREIYPLSVTRESSRLVSGKSRAGRACAVAHYRVPIGHASDTAADKTPAVYPCMYMRIYGARAHTHAYIHPGWNNALAAMERDI